MLRRVACTSIRRPSAVSAHAVLPWTTTRRRRSRIQRAGAPADVPGGGVIYAPQRTGTLLDCPQLTRWDDFMVAPMARVLLHYSGWSSLDDGNVASKVRRALPEIDRGHAHSAVTQTRACGRAILMTAPPAVAEAAVGLLRSQGLHATLLEA